MKMKIVFTLPWGERLGGAENILWIFLQHVDRRTIEPIVVFFAPGRFEREVAAKGIRTVILPAGRLRHARSAVRVVRSLARLLRHEKPDLLVNWSSKTHLYGAPAAALARMEGRVVWWQHGMPKHHWMDRLATLFPAHAVGCWSHASAAAQQLHQPRRRTFVVHPGIEPPSPLPDEERLRVRESLGIPTDQPVVGIVGRLQPWKGQDRVLRALAVLRERGISLHGLIVGGDAYHLSPEYEPYLHQLVDELGLSDIVTFTGQVRDANPYIRAMDVLVNASSDEPFGLVIVEAMALGTPVVAVASAGPMEIIESRKSGVLIPTSGDCDIADGVATLLTNLELMCHVATGGQQRFRAHFTADQMTERFLREFRLVTAATR